MLRVGMDISQTAFPGVVSVYTNNLSEQLSKNQALEMIFFYSSLRKKYKGDLKNVKKYKLPPTLFEMLFNKWRNVSIEKFIGPVDIFHSSDWTQPPSKARKVTTYHDIVPLKYPQWSHPKIVAIYEAPTGDFKPQPEGKIRQFREKYNLPEKFVLAIGGIGERRNLSRVKQAAKDYNLVIAGQSLPWLGIDELELLYNCATVLLYPSLYEGFGLPILDSFTCGLPVISSNVSAMPE